MFAGKLRREWWSRFANARWSELRTRGDQEIAKRLDVAFYRLGVSFEDKSFKSVWHPPAQFFFLPDDLPQLLTLLCERLPHEVDQILEDADGICRHRFHLLGYRSVDYGPQIDWHLDAVHAKRAPMKPWFKVRYLDFDEVGDHKVVWELNRHQHLVVLAKAYLLTREERYRAELLRQWYHWRQSNPYPIGINWASSLEVSFRSLSWLWVRHLMAYGSAGADRFELDLVRGLALNARHIERYLSTYFSPNTHLLGEGVALFFIGTLCPQLPSARRWQWRGWEIVRREAGRQVQPDGMHFEQSVYYHVYALDFFLHARVLAARNGMAIPDSFDRTLQKMFELVARLGQAGPPPRLGDDDGGRVFNPRRNRAEHMLDPLAVGAVIFGRGDLKGTGRGLTEEAVWLLGPKGAAQFDQLSPAPSSLLSARYEPSGIYLMASSEPTPHQLVIDAGPQGASTAGHGHSDALSLQLSVKGREWLVDSGTFCYVSSGNERDQFRGTGAHNTFQVDGTNQAEATGPFAWRLLPNVRAEQWVTGQTFDLFEGSHTGYSRLREPVTHRRWVFNLKSRFWLVRDRAEGTGQHQMEVNWHLAPGFEPGPMGQYGSVLRAGEKANLVFLPVQGHAWSQRISQSRISAVYGHVEPAMVLTFVARAVLPAEIAVVLLTFETSVHELKDFGAFTRLVDGTSGIRVSGFCYHVGEERHYMFFAERNHIWKLGPWESDAQFLYCGVTPQGRQQWILCGGSYAEIGGHRVVRCRQRVDRCELTSGGTARQVFCSDESAPNELSEDVLASAQTVLHAQGAVNSPRGVP